ncbi:MAG: hypothetical protein ABJQ29_10470 [Luteolibacter sp.]
MKTTIDLPDPLFRKVKATAAAEGVSLKAFIAEAVEQRLNTGARPLGAVLGSLPIVPKKLLNQIQKRVEMSDAEDLALQKGNGQ